MSDKTSSTSSSRSRSTSHPSAHTSAAFSPSIALARLGLHNGKKRIHEPRTRNGLSSLSFDLDSGEDALQLATQQTPTNGFRGKYQLAIHSPHTGSSFILTSTATTSSCTSPSSTTSAPSTFETREHTRRGSSPQASHGHLAVSSVHSSAYPQSPGPPTPRASPVSSPASSPPSSRPASPVFGGVGGSTSTGGGHGCPHRTCKSHDPYLEGSARGLGECTQACWDFCREELKKSQSQCKQLRQRLDDAEESDRLSQSRIQDLMRNIENLQFQLLYGATRKDQQIERLKSDVEREKEKSLELIRGLERRARQADDTSSDKTSSSCESNSSSDSRSPASPELDEEALNIREAAALASASKSREVKRVQRLEKELEWYKSSCETMKRNVQNKLFEMQALMSFHERVQAEKEAEVCRLKEENENLKKELQEHKVKGTQKRLTKNPEEKLNKPRTKCGKPDGLSFQSQSKAQIERIQQVLGSVQEALLLEEPPEISASPKVANSQISTIPTLTSSPSLSSSSLPKSARATSSQRRSDMEMRQEKKPQQKKLEKRSRHQASTHSPRHQQVIFEEQNKNKKMRTPELLSRRLSFTKQPEKEPFSAQLDFEKSKTRNSPRRRVMSDMAGIKDELFGVVTKEKPKEKSHETMPCDFPIFLAAQGGDLKALNKLLEGGIDPEVLSKDNMNAMHYACQKGHVPILEALLKARPNYNVNVQSSTSDSTALMLAAQGGYAPAVHFLLKHHADASLKNKDGYNAETLCGSSANPLILRMIRNAIREQSTPSPLLSPRLSSPSPSPSSSLLGLSPSLLASPQFQQTTFPFPPTSTSPSDGRS